MRKILFFSLLTFVMSAGTVLGQQTSDDLKKKQAEIQQEISELKRTLDDTKKNKKASLGQLALIKRKLRLREQAIGNINDQINVIERSIGQSRSEISRLKTELDTLKLEYEKSVVYAYKNRSNYDFLNFIFSANTFNDALKRIEYLKSYRLYREQQAETIRNTQDLLHGKITGLESSRKQKDEVLQKAEKEKVVLVNDRKEKDEIVNKLKSREKEIDKELKAKVRADAKLKAAVRAAIDREIKIARDKAMAAERAEREREKERAKLANANKPATPNNNNASAAPETKKAEKEKPVAARKESYFEATPEALELSGNFEKNKGKLPWPVGAGHIKIGFGTYEIEGIGGSRPLRGNNPGVTIETEVGASVKAVFEGEVFQVFDVDGNWAVMVRHGKYFTVYSGLSAVSISKGQKVATGQMLGRAGANNDDKGEIEFVIMQEQSNVNPEAWIRKR